MEPDPGTCITHNVGGPHPKFADKKGIFADRKWRFADRRWKYADRKRKYADEQKKFASKYQNMPTNAEIYRKK